MAKKNIPIKKLSSFMQDAIASWIKYDPFVRAIVQNDNCARRDVMLNLVGKEAAIRHFGKFPPKRPFEGPIYPNTVRELVETSLLDKDKRTECIAKLIYWATDPMINNRYLNSHLTRIQIISSLMGAIFFHSNPSQEDMIFKGLKYMLVNKRTILDERGEQSLDVHQILVRRVGEMLIHNQKVIINAAVHEAEEKMRIHLIRQIQDLRSRKSGSEYISPELKRIVREVVHEKFPLRASTREHLEDMLEFYTESTFPEIKYFALKEKNRLEEIRKPLTLTGEVKSG